MARKKESVNEWERSWAGCYGSKVAYEQLNSFLENCFVLDDMVEQHGGEHFATVIWGHAGIGKSALVKQFANHPVIWRGKEYPGYKVHDVPVGQFEEMGDLHGMPSRHVLVEHSNGESVERWVPEEVLPEYRQDGWKVIYDAGVRTMYAPPDWVPKEPGPSILLLDDFNRPSLRILKGLMQLFQNYGLVSWKLPEGCHIVMTGNPDEQDYLVTSIDAAILTRLRSITLKEDPKEWAVWAEGAGLDPRGINFVLRYPEQFIGPERTNPRTLSEFFRFSATVGKATDKENMKKLEVMGNAMLDEQTVTSCMVFFSRDVELVVEPEQILAGDEWACKHTEDLMSRREKRIDIVGVMCDRLFAALVTMRDTPNPQQVKNFQRFITLDCIPDDMRHNLCLRMVRAKDNKKLHAWLWGNKQLKKLILSVV